jgi:hypothetical protein
LPGGLARHHVAEAQARRFESGGHDVTTEVIIRQAVAQPAHEAFWLIEEEGMDRWVYFFGKSDGSAVKIGRADRSIRRRRRGIETAQLSPTRLVLLAAIRGGPQQEVAVKKHFAPHLLHEPGTNNTETFYPVPELVEYVNWLRQQYFTWTNEDDGPDEQPAYQAWCPGPGRHVALDEPVPGVLVQEYDMSNGVLNGTPWSPLARPLPPHNDYYTPVEIVCAAREAMGGIDLDPATHWTAARAHGITNYYHQYKSAFDNPWAGRVWLNPPYGENKEWFDEIVRWWDKGEITQLCMLSPVWAFSTTIARPVIERSSAMLLFCPTPKFWGRHKSGRVVEEGSEELGVNHPHAILYLGPRVAEFKAAFAEYGTPMRLTG